MWTGFFRAMTKHKERFKRSAACFVVTPVAFQDSKFLSWELIFAHLKYFTRFVQDVWVVFCYIRGRNYQV